ncbi:MAG: hypothetical protein D6768_20330 [Chloroflexi bacterium]|nr:MAG: hypothetical protein D6768_20330 [Chloroflexota bacterium]
MFSALNANKIHQIAIFLLLLVCYAYTFPRWADPNQNSRLNMVVAVVEDGTFQIDKYVQNTVDYAKVGEHYYSDKAPGAAFLAMPFYAGLKLFLDLPVLDSFTERLAHHQAFQSTLRSEGSGVLAQKVRFALAQVALTFVVAAVPSALLGVLLFNLLGQFTQAAAPRIAVTLGYGLLTPAFAYAGAFYGHQLSAALLFGAFALLFTRKERLTAPVLLLVGLLLGYSVVTEYPAALAVVILTVYALFLLAQRGRWRHIGWVMLTGGLVALGWMAYNTAIFGGPLELGYSYSELWQDQHHTGFMSLSFPQPATMWGITFGLFRGLFVLSPLLLLVFPGFVQWWRSGEQRAEWTVALLISVSIFLFNSSSVMWWGGFAIGPRYLLPALPFAATAMIFPFRAWGRKTGFRLLAAALAGWSLVATWGLTLAEQAFPNDNIFNPLLEYALPNWLAGNVARNAGTILGLRGVWSLLPLLALVILLGAAWWWLAMRAGKQTAQTTPVDIQQNVVSAR